MGFNDIGSRRKIDRAIKSWVEKREFLKADAIKAKVAMLNEASPGAVFNVGGAGGMPGVPNA